MSENGTPAEMSPLDGTTAEPLPPHVVRHRGEFVAYVQEHAEPGHRLALGRLYDLWFRWNNEFFEGRMLAPYIMLCEPVAPNVYGDCSTVSGFGGRLQIRIRPSLVWGGHPCYIEAPNLEGCFRFAADVLLHEMIHQFQMEFFPDRREEGYHGHGPWFRDQCVRIGAALGLPAVRDSKKRGKDKDLPSCAQWPHSVRPREYYLGALADERERALAGLPGWVRDPATVVHVLTHIDLDPDDARAIAAGLAEHFGLHVPTSRDVPGRTPEALMDAVVLAMAREGRPTNTLAFLQLAAAARERIVPATGDKERGAA